MNAFDRRSFIRNTTIAGIAAGVAPAAASRALAYPRPTENKISLATWSLVRSFRAGVWKLTDIHRICRNDFGIDGVEYVTAFFEAPVAGYLDRLNKASQEFGVTNVLIMVDNEGQMISKDPAVRKQSVINHRKWIEVANYLGCHAIRCNAHGGGNSLAEDPDAIDRAAESFGSLLEYAKEFKVNIVIENHGGLSSEPDFLPGLARKLNTPNFGILPDYGNYTAGSDVASAVKKAMPYALGVSVKAGWQPDGSHPQYDLAELLKISQSAGYTGFWGIESGIRHGRGQAPEDAETVKKEDWQAVKWTKEVIDKTIFA